MLSDNLKIDMLPEVELSNKALAAESLVTDAGTRNDHRAAGTGLGKPGGRSLAYHGEEPGITVAVGQAHRAVARAQQSRGVAGAIVVGVAHHFEPELVVAHLSEDIAVPLRDEVVELIDAAVSSEREDALFREEIVELELAQLYVKPRAAKQVIEPGHDGFKVK